MNTLDKMVIRSLFPVFSGALVFFMLILQLVDLFSNLWRYLSHEVPAESIIEVMVLYTPKTISYALPIAFLFSVSYILGLFYSNNELISVFGSGIPLKRFILPVLILGAVLSIGGYFFEERVVIDTFKQKNELNRELLNQKVSESNTNITAISDNGKVIYNVGYYNDSNMTLSKILVLIRDENGELQSRIDADSAEWEGDHWRINNPRIFQRSNGDFFENRPDLLTEIVLSEPPSTFRKTTRNVEEMNSKDAREWIKNLQRSGLPYKGALAEYYQRYSFALTPFIVSIIASSLGGRFKKNVLLMSLLISLIFSVVYYVLQMILVLMAKLGYVPPLAGTLIPIVFFLLIGIGLFKQART